jgi:hypothetical protein
MNRVLAMSLVLVLVMPLLVWVVRKIRWQIRTWKRMIDELFCMADYTVITSNAIDERRGITATGSKTGLFKENREIGFYWFVRNGRIRHSRARHRSGRKHARPDRGHPLPTSSGSVGLTYRGDDARGLAPLLCPCGEDRFEVQIHGGRKYVTPHRIHDTAVFQRPDQPDLTPIGDPSHPPGKVWSELEVQVRLTGEADERDLIAIGDHVDIRPGGEIPVLDLFKYFRRVMRDPLGRYRTRRTTSDRIGREH